MKVILVRDVARLGRRNEIKDVPDGHALNFLIPRKLAVIATPQEVKRLTEEVQKHTAAHGESVHAFLQACETLKSEPVTYEVEASEQGQLFKGINERDIALMLKERMGIVLHENTIKLPHHIKSVGTHEVHLSFEGHEGVCTLHVVKK